ncbi:APC family permease [Streptomyces sp. ISL-36]|nr:APC family permease [Streptomyces sp. ISL-36]
MAMGIAAVISFDVVGQIATGGGQALTWTGALALLFLVPYALIFAETGAAFPQEGGPYVWVKLAFGRLAAALTTLFYWVTNPVWLGGSLVFAATEAWDRFVLHLGSGTVADYVFKLVFIWVSILTAVVSLRRGKWITTAGAVAKVFLVLLFTGTALVYGLRHGFQGLHQADFSPTTAGFLALVPILLFAYVGFEAPNAAGDEMHDPKKDVPVSIGVAAAVAACSYLLPVLAILSVTPADKVTGVGGFLDAAKLVFDVYGGWGTPLLTTAAVLFVFTLLTQGSAWMIVSDRMQAMAAADGGFFHRGLGAFHDRLGTPLRMNLVSGVTATLFMVAATTLVHGDTAAVFGVVLTVAVTTLLLSYLVVIPSLVVLRRKHRDVPRPYTVPFGTVGFLVCAGLVYAWIALGSWTALFPGTLEPLLGVTYDFTGTWGVSRPTFELFTLGTVVLLLSVGGLGRVLAAAQDRRAGTYEAPVAETEPLHA